MNLMQHSDDLHDGGIASQRFYGLYPATVKRIVDPPEPGRIQVGFPWMGDAGSKVTAWARLMTLYADENQGWEILPSVGTEVIVAFEAGLVNRAYIVGAVWNGRERLPEPPTEANDKRLLRTRSGSLLEFDDSEGAARVTLSMRNGHRLVLEETPAQVTLSHANGCEVVMEVSGRVRIQANATVEVRANALNVHATTSTFHGDVICKNLTCQTGLSSPLYTMGAGNIL